MLIQFASTPTAVDRQIDQARLLMAADRVDLVRGDEEISLWREHACAVWAAAGAVIKMSWLPARLPAVLSHVDEIAQANNATIEMVGRAGVGAGVLRVDADATGQVAIIERLRASPTVVANVVVLRAHTGAKAKVDVWGPRGDTASLLRAVKRSFDPAGILNAGRGPI